MAHWLFLSTTFVLLTSALAKMKNSKMSMDIQTEYFKSANLTCDSIHLNITESWQKIETIQWMLPDANLITESRDKIIIIKANNFAYQISIDRVGDDEFGYYTCIIVYKPVNGMKSEVKVVRWGLNIGGPDFSRLRSEYADHAVVGAIAAGVLLGVMGLICLIWHYRYNSRRNRKDVNHYESTTQAYNNRAYQEIDNIKHVDQSNNRSLEPVDADNIDVHM